MALADTTVAELLEQVAQRTPAPAGGAAAGLAGATAAALTEMAAAFAFDRSGGEDESVASLMRRAGALRMRLLTLADEDTNAYEPVLAALRIGRRDPLRAEALRAEALRTALSGAAEVPLEIAAAAAEVAELAAAIAGADGNELLLGDVRTALLLAQAATSAAAALVALNLRGTPQDSRLQRAEGLARQANQQRVLVSTSS